MTKIIPLIMCGGAGTRLWPSSRENRPKQFLPLFGARSSFQETVLRVRDPSLFDRPIIVTNAVYRFVVKEQLDQIGLEADILLEPVRRDSGPAIAAGAIFASRLGPLSIVIALAADHVVRDPVGFVAACRQGLPTVEAGRILTFGILPDEPSSEYGYIQPANTDAPAAIVRFVEKPDRATAECYVANGYLWNSGNFMFRADVLLDEYRRSDAATVENVTTAVETSEVDAGFVVLDRDAFREAAARSIDYAVMERTSLGSVIGISIGWSDVGSWKAVWDLTQKDATDAGTGIFVQVGQFR